MKQTLWQIKPVERVVRVPGIPDITIPVYPSLLVAEAEHAQLLQAADPKPSNIEFTNKVVVFCLKHRGVLDHSIPDDEVIQQLPQPLAEALFRLFYYGPTGKPEDPMSYVYSEADLGNGEEPPLTGENSSGSSSDGTQVASTLLLVNTDTAPPSLSLMQPESIKTSA